MIQKFSIVQIADNSGAKLARCIHVYGGYRKKYATVGSKILVSILSMRKIKNQKRGKAKDKTEKGGVAKAILIRTKLNKMRNNLNKSIFKENAIVLINEKNKIISTRIFGATLNNLRKTRFLRIATLADGVIKI